MRIRRHFTKDTESAYSTIEFRNISSEIRNPDGSIVFQLDCMEVPDSWSQVACDVLAQKYFRKAGVPSLLKKVEENDVPSWLWRSVPDEEALTEASLLLCSLSKPADLNNIFRPPWITLDLLSSLVCTA